MKRKKCLACKRIFKGLKGLKIHLRLSPKCRQKKTNCHCVQKEVWLAPPPEIRSPWDCDYTSKKIFTEALGLKFIGEEIDDDQVPLFCYEPYEDILREATGKKGLRFGHCPKQPRTPPYTFGH